MFELSIFFVFAATAIVFALVVILHRNPVVSALALVACFFSLAVMYILLEAPFLAALQVIVYTGAIMVLFLFVIMLLNLQHQHEALTRPVQQFLGWMAGATFCLSLIFYLLQAAAPVMVSGAYDTSARAIGFKLFESYILPFEAVSILLLAAIVGALVLSARGSTTVKGDTEQAR
ncbi:MAG TPA: NADH-quinone oxidoreductase subunit J [Thermoanaerobaculia bacterium]|nr:NADH-quinone oxidoreductase subunit J [Thermoanaerobaculia bacterium]